MDIVSRVVSETKDSATLPQTRIIRTYSQDAARLEGKGEPAPIKAPLASAPETAPRKQSDAPQRRAVPVPVPAKDPEPTKQEGGITTRPGGDMLVFPARRQVLQQLTATEVDETGPQKHTPSPIHTYNIDFAEHVKKTNASPLSVLAAERDSARPQLSRERGREKHTVRFIVIGTLLLALGGGGSYAAYSYLAPSATTILRTQVSSLIFADEQQEVFGSGEILRTAVVASVADPLPSGAVRILYTSTSTAEAIGRQPVSGKELIQAMELGAPDILMRNTNPESTFGVIHAGGVTHPFFIFKVASFESTFRGMLDWEATIAKDLSLFYPAHTDPEPSDQRPVEETPPVETPEASVPTFTDQSIANNDVRILLDSKGRTVLLYGYRDKTTLIIARDAAAFTEIVGRLAATRQQ